jgi:hypothetical protein
LLIEFELRTSERAPLYLLGHNRRCPSAVVVSVVIVQSELCCGFD